MAKKTKLGYFSMPPFIKPGKKLYVPDFWFCQVTGPRGTSSQSNFDMFDGKKKAISYPLVIILQLLSKLLLEFSQLPLTIPESRQVNKCPIWKYSIHIMEPS
jgi:hypothetical protein